MPTETDTRRSDQRSYGNRSSRYDSTENHISGKSSDLKYNLCFPIEIWRRCKNRSYKHFYTVYEVFVHRPIHQI